MWKLTYFKHVKPDKSLCKYVYVWDMCQDNFCVFSLMAKNVNNGSKSNSFEWAQYWNMIWFQKTKPFPFAEENYLKYTKKTQFWM